ncbi:hypothetical protein [Actinosynnema mirum]|uniref:Uncharacterized protein n=1 Tax=Actinosynnema mirum (strain ATCC 29888 / DSM 43827 / JCM 3225 / NBRC 14064 / NCIMB 13271 / NRRL B-12336 / IMRU 3971 / 101) TaxID=446462 RepID=C6WBK6_ACTMD|nr:hypothetical protein [Actinosynnema mirum]ACU35574.1 hypothetical protein Amir_1625 [Actinosynnema mirum DSM 43827]
MTAPARLLTGPDALRLLAEIRDAMRTALREIETLLRRGDVNAADEYLEMVLHTSGEWAHDRLLHAIAQRRGMPSWRTYR